MNDLTQKNNDELKAMSVFSAAFFTAVTNIVLLNLSSVHKCSHLVVLMVISILMSAVFMFLKNFRMVEFKTLNLLWCGFLLFTFPWSTTFLVIENQDNFWFYIYFLATLFYVLNAIESKHVDSLIVFSIASAFLVEKLIEGELYLSPQIKYFYGTVFCFVFFVSYYIFKISKASQQQIQKLRFLGGAIAHELRTPLSIIISGMCGLQEALPVLMDAYKLRYSELDKYKRYEPHQLQTLVEMPDTVMQTAQEGAIMIDMLLMKIKTNNVKLDCSTRLNATSILQKSIDEYPFGLGEKEKIKFHPDNNFDFYSNENAFKHVFFNLLKNALYQIANHKKGEIEIWFTHYGKYNYIHFKDTAIGIKEEDVTHIFTEAYKVSENGTGIGLPFCKFILESSDGDIDCKSIFNKYTEFVLKLPTITHKK